MKRFSFFSLAFCLTLSSAALAETEASHGEAHAAEAPHHRGAGEAEAEHGAHEEGAHGHHDPSWADVNWFYGFLGEKEGVEPNLLYRKPGMPVPVGVLFLNTALLFFIIGKIAGPSLGQGLRDRKQRIAGDIEAASAMKSEAEGQLAFYENKLAQMAAEMERIKVDMRAQAALEREQILKDAVLRREAMEREARHLVEQELAATKQTVAHLVAHEAIRLARGEIQKSLTPADNERLAKEFLGDLEKRSTREVVS